jgi:hypothetical protein
VTRCAPRSAAPRARPARRPRRIRSRRPRRRGGAGPGPAACLRRPGAAAAAAAAAAALPVSSRVGASLVCVPPPPHLPLGPRPCPAAGPAPHHSALEAPGPIRCSPWRLPPRPRAARAPPRRGHGAAAALVTRRLCADRLLGTLRPPPARTTVRAASYSKESEPHNTTHALTACRRGAARADDGRGIDSGACGRRGGRGSTHGGAWQPPRLKLVTRTRRSNAAAPRFPGRRLKTGARTGARTGALRQAPRLSRGAPAAPRPLPSSGAPPRR